MAGGSGGSSGSTPSAACGIGAFTRRLTSPRASKDAHWLVWALLLTRPRPTSAPPAHLPPSAAADHGVLHVAAAGGLGGAPLHPAAHRRRPTQASLSCPSGRRPGCCVCAAMLAAPSVSQHPVDSNPPFTTSRLAGPLPLPGARSTSQPWQHRLPASSNQ